MRATLSGGLSSLGQNPAFARVLTEPIAAHCESWSPWCSSTMRTARSHSCRGKDWMNEKQHGLGTSTNGGKPSTQW